MKKNIVICILSSIVILKTGYLCHAQTPPSSATQNSTTNLPPETQQTAPQVPQQQSSETNAKLTTPNSEAIITALIDDPVIAKGNGVEIKQSALNEIVLGIKSAAAAHNETIQQKQLFDIEKQMLNRLVQIQLLLQKTTDADKASGKMKAGLQIAALLERAGSQEEFDRQLRAVGMTREVLRTKITEEATATAALTRELGITVTDSEVKQYYLDHPKDFKDPATGMLALTDKVPQTNLTIADKIKDFLIQQKTQKLAPAYLDNLKKTANVEVLDVNLK